MPTTNGCTIFQKKKRKKKGEGERFGVWCSICKDFQQSRGPVSRSGWSFLISGGGLAYRGDLVDLMGGGGRCTVGR